MIRHAVSLALALTLGLGATFAAPAMAAKAGKEARVALIFGNSNYKVSPLRNPVNDAKLVAKSLRATGFDVILKVDASRRDMRRAMIDFGRKLRDGGVGLFYYAGHGISVGGENYLIPVDAEIEVEDHVPVESVALNQVLARMGGARNRLNIVILDACRNNPFARSFRSGTRGLTQTLAPSGTYIAYATAPGDVAEDGKGKNSIYSEALARAVKTPGVKIEDVFKNVRRRVHGSTDGRQVPWTSSSITGDFFFTAKPKEPPKQVAALPPKPAPPPVPTGPSKGTLDLAFWQSIKDSRNESDFKAYLGQFPKGTFAGLARSRMAAVKQEKAEQVMRQRLADARRTQAEVRARSQAGAQSRTRRVPQLAALPPPETAPAAPAAPQGRMHASQIRERLSGQRIVAKRKDGTKVRVLFRPNGTLAGTVIMPRATHKDTGLWSVEADDVLCTQWRKFKGAKRRCFYLKTDGPNAFWFLLRGGDEVQRYALARGNAAGSGNLSKLLKGKRITFHRRRDGREVEVWLGKDEQATFSVANRSGDMSVRDNGRWWIEPGNRLCIKFDRGLRGRRSCSVIDTRGGKIAAKSPMDGSPRRWRIQ